MVKKTIKDFTVKSAQHLSEAYTLLKLTPTDGTEVTPALPGQFVQVAVPDAPNTATTPSGFLSETPAKALHGSAE